ncbi:MAG: phasin family protein [Burkholderiaceae bacterium]|nr:phasin family protein [Burkholderiaceae bacterium]
MVKKLKKLSADQAAGAHTGAQLAQSVKESAQQIWLAGLGAFSKAQAEGGKVFETLVKDGLGLQRKTQAAAEERISEATSKMTDMASGITSKATGQWDKLENIFEDRVAKALNKLGVPSAKDVQALTQRVDELSKKIQKTPAKPVVKAAVKTVAPVAKKAATAKSPVAKPAVKRTAARKTA